MNAIPAWLETFGETGEVHDPEALAALEAIDAPFAMQCILELLANGRKGDWKDWKPDMPTLIQEIDHHLNKLRRAFLEQDPARISEYSADIANFCAKAHALHGLPTIDHEEMDSRRG